MHPSVRAHWLTAGFLVGTVDAAVAHRPFLGWELVVIAVLLWLLRKQTGIAVFGFALCGYLVGVNWVFIWRAEHRANYVYNQDVTISGTIVQPVDVRSDHLLLTIQPKNSRADLLVRSSRYPLYQYGDQLRIRGVIEKAAPFNGFNYPLFLERSNIAGVVMLPKSVYKTGYDPPSRIDAALYQLRQHLEQQINLNLPEPESSFLAGILLGSKRAIPANIQAELQATGTTHIIAISGENITVLLVIILRLIPVGNQRIKLYLTAVIALFMTVLTGASASVIRGAVVATLACWIRLRSRRAWITPLLLCSMMLCLMDNPLLLAADPGFQLSFSAFAGLLYLGSFCTNWFQHSFFQRWPPIVVAGLAETIAATLGTLPLSLHQFGQLPLLGFLVNPLVLWLIPPITFISLFFIIIGNIIPLVHLILKLPLWLLLHAALSIIGWFGNLNLGVIHWQISWWLVGCFYLGIYLLIARLHHAHQST